MLETKCFAAQSSSDPLEEYMITRRDLGKRDVLIKIEFCGVCHTDLHYAKNDWGITKYPFVGGHEIIGEVVQVGSQIKRLKVDDKVAVGCFVNSCRKCSSCKNDMEQYCTEKLVKTYNDPTSDPGGHTFGGYSRFIVVDEHFVFSLPKNLDLAGSAPLLCAGITVFSPLNYWNIRKNSLVGIIGLGGLGHMAVKFTKALGAKAIVFTTSKEKILDAQSLGADEVVLSNNKKDFNKMNGKLDFVLNTIPVSHKSYEFCELLKVNGTMCIVGSIGPSGELNTRPLIFGRRSIAGSLVGGVNETTKMLNLCGEKNITADIELISMKEINNAFTRLKSNDVKYRFVIDLKTL